MRRHHLLTAAAGFAVLFAAGSAIAQTRNTLDIYVVDVEGGNATLFVAPSGESLLIDTGNYGPEASRAGCRAHHGGGEGCRPDPDRPPHHHPLARRSFRRHGRARQAHPDPPLHRPRPERSARRRRSTNSSQKIYPPLYANAKHTVAKVGDKIPIDGLDVTHRHLGRRDDQDAARRRGRAQSLLRELQARREQRRRPDVGRHLHHLRQIPHHASRRPHQEQGVRADVPDQPDRHASTSSSACITASTPRTRR